MLNYAFLDSAKPADFFGRTFAISLAPLFHILGFSALAMFAALFWPRRNKEVVVCLLVAAAGIEVAQMFISGRRGSVPDLLWSSAGVAVGMLVARFLASLRQ